MIESNGGRKLVGSILPSWDKGYEEEGVILRVHFTITNKCFMFKNLIQYIFILVTVKINLK